MFGECVALKGLTVCGVRTAKSGVSYDVVNQYSSSVVAANLITLTATYMHVYHMYCPLCIIHIQ